MSYLDESLDWDRRVAIWCGPAARLVHVSSHSSDIRVYDNGSRIFKLRRLTPASVHDRPNSLEDEHLVLVHLSSLASHPAAYIPKAVSYRSEPGWECLELSPIEPPMTYDPVTRPAVESVRSLIALGRAVWRLNRAGVSHGDLEPQNAGLTASGVLAILDFDQAAIGHWVRCVLRDFLGIPAGGRVSRRSVLGRAGMHPVARLVIRLLVRLRRILGGGRDPASGPWSARNRAAARRDCLLVALADAWREAAASGANSPGSQVAYYSLDVDGLHFPGERPWVMRWWSIAHAVDFRGKRLVELGCNMGLLSIHARFAGAVGATGADVNPRVIKAAERTASAFSVDVRFVVVDFDHDPEWETSLGTGDIVSALSLTYWLKDRERLWRYMSKFNEILFEGHESEWDIRSLFSTNGFDHVVALGLSERKRMLFHATRSATL